MAEALVKFFLHRMKYMLVQEAETFAGLEDELDWLMSNLGEVGWFFETIGSMEGDPAVSSWVNELRDLIFDTENQIDEFVVQMVGEEWSDREALVDQFRSELQKIESTLAEKVIRMTNLDSSSTGESSDFSAIKSIYYTGLPYYLRTTLMYCCIFPENYRIPKGRLIRLLVAEGLIQENEDKILEDIAGENIDLLVTLGMLQRDDKHPCNGTKLKVHISLSEFLLRKMEGEKSCTLSGDPFNICGVSVHTDMTEVASKLSNLQPRSLLVFGNQILYEEKPNWLCFHGAKFLRVLDLEGTKMESLPDEVGDLIHLRYLGLKGTNISELPEKLGNLRALQTLDIRWCGNITEMSDEILNLKRLRHLKMFKNIGVSGMKLPAGIARLKDLLTLTGAHAGGDIARELGNMIQLRKLGMMDVSQKTSNELFASIMKMQELLGLSLQAKHAFNQELLPLSETFSPPPLIKKLKLEGSLKRIPNWLGSMVRLTKLRLSFSHLSENPSLVLQFLPNLKDLTLWHAYEAKQIGRDFCDGGGFPKLEVLSIASHVLEEWREIEEGAFPNLKYLHLHNCLRLRMLPEGLQFVTTLMQLDLLPLLDDHADRLKPDGGEENHKIRHIPSVKFTTMSMLTQLAESRD